MNTLDLVIGNIDRLEHGLIARHRFDRNGGSIGSGPADWLLWDRAQRIQPLHCEIRWIEGSFCAVDLCNQTYLNDSPRSLGERSPVRLQQGDRLHIGSYRVHVHCQQHSADEQSLEELFSPGQRLLAALIADAAADPWQIEVSAQKGIVDICTAFDRPLGHDPLAALDALLDTPPANADALQRLIAGEQA